MVPFADDTPMTLIIEQSQKSIEDVIEMGKGTIEMTDDEPRY